MAKREYRQRSCDDEFVPKGPHAFIQWKGTDVCADLYCACGHHGHFDGEFFYFYQCTCGRVYEVGSHVPLIEVTGEAEIADVCADGRCQREDTSSDVGPRNAD